MKKLMLILVVMVFVVPAISWSQDIPNGYTEDSKILKKYGAVAHETFEKHSGIVSAAKKSFSKFKVKEMETSYPSVGLKAKDGKDYLVLSGCTKHNCAGTINVLIYDVREKKTYLYRQLEDDYFGKPPENVKKLLNFYYNLNVPD